MRIGIDLGGTKIEFIALASDGKILARNRIPTPVGDYDATIEAIRAGVAGIETQASETGSVGIGIPGSVSPATGLVKNANSTCRLKDLGSLFHVIRRGYKEVRWYPGLIR